MAGPSEALDKLVGLFIKSAVGEDATLPVKEELSKDAVARGIEVTEKMLCSEDALRMGGMPAPTFVCLAMAMEDKPHLQWAALACYECALKYLRIMGKRRGAISWEHIVVKMHMGLICLQHGRIDNGRLDDAVTWLAECAEACVEAVGHPRDVVLFDGNFSIQQTKVEFMANVERLRAATFHKLGDERTAHAHLEESKRHDAMLTGDAVERIALAKADTGSGTSVGAAGDLKQLWSATADQEKRLIDYRFTDEGPTVLVVLDLNDHLGLGDAASVLVDSLKQFRVRCEDRSLDLRLRTRHDDGRIREFQLCVQLMLDIIPEDTVPRLRGREGKRRFEVKLFKRDKERTWHNLGTTGGTGSTKAATKAPPAKGTQLNPMTAEEVANLPRPGGDLGNRPSGYLSSAEALAPTPDGAGLEEMD